MGEESLWEQIYEGTIVEFIVDTVLKNEIDDEEHIIVNGTRAEVRAFYSGNTGDFALLKIEGFENENPFPISKSVLDNNPPIRIINDHTQRR